MDRRELKRYAAGYLTGGIFFLIVIPSIIYSASYLTGGILPSFILRDNRVMTLCGGILFIPGIVFMIWSNASLFFIGKGGPTEGFGIEISPKTRVLVTKGPYKYTRNPMVFGAYLMYLGFAVFLNSFPSLILVLMLLPVIIFYLKKSEEKRLADDFGEEYIKYRGRVPLLIPFPFKKKD